MPDPKYLDVARVNVQRALAFVVASILGVVIVGITGWFYGYGTVIILSPTIGVVLILIGAGLYLGITRYFRPPG